MSFTEPCVEDKYFFNHKFTKEEHNVFTRIEPRFFNNMQTGERECIEKHVKFKIYDVDPELGTNIELYINYQLYLSGYWTDKKDFESAFKL